MGHVNFTFENKISDSSPSKVRQYIIDSSPSKVRQYIIVELFYVINRSLSAEIHNYYDICVRNLSKGKLLCELRRFVGFSKHEILQDKIVEKKGARNV